MNEEVEIIAVVLIILGLVLAIFTCGISLLLTMLGIILLFAFLFREDREVHIYHHSPRYYDERYGYPPPRGYYQYHHYGRPPPGYYPEPPREDEDFDPYKPSSRRDPYRRERY